MLSEQIKLHQEMYSLLGQLRNKGLEISKVESDFVFYSHPVYANNGPYKIRRGNMREGDRIECHCFDRDNINKLLIELDLGDNLTYISAKNDSVGVDESFSSYWEGVSDNVPKTQAKALSDKWFGLREENGQPISSLWDSGEEGQLQVLTELIEVIKNNTYG